MRLFKRISLLKSRITAALNFIHQVQEDEGADLIKADSRDATNGDVQRGNKLVFYYCKYSSTVLKHHLEVFTLHLTEFTF